MEKILVKSLFIAAVGGITFKAIQAARLYSKQVKEHEEVMNDADED